MYAPNSSAQKLVNSTLIPLNQYERKYTEIFWSTEINWYVNIILNEWIALRLLFTIHLAKKVLWYSKIITLICDYF